MASTPTAWRVLADIDPAALATLRAARAAARETAWLQAAETGTGIPAARAGGRDLPGLVLDLDATLISCHSEKEQAAATYKHGFGYHPPLGFLDNTGEALAGLLRPGTINAAWLELSLTAIDLLAWTQTLLLEGELATAEPKKLRYRVLHAAARITRGGRRLHLRIAAAWPWRHHLTTAFARLAALPRPAT